MFIKIIAIIIFLYSNISANTLQCRIDESEKEITIEIFSHFIKVDNKYKVFYRDEYSGHEPLFMASSVYSNKGYIYYLLNNLDGTYLLYIKSKYQKFQSGICNFDEKEK